MQSDILDSRREAEKRAAAEQAAGYVQDGMAVGLGTGSTAAYMIAALIVRAQAGLKFVGLPTSERSAAQARAGGLTLVDFDTHPTLDLTIDGADQVAAGTLDLVKGLGGALTREKIVAAASAQLVIVVDAGKLAEVLAIPVPVEVVRFGWQATRRRIEVLGATTTLRTAPYGSPYVTDGGGFILDCAFGTLKNPGGTDRALRDIVGVVETGLFIGRANEVLVAEPGGVRRLLRP